MMNIPSRIQNRKDIEQYKGFPGGAGGGGGGGCLVTKLCPTLETPKTVACQAPLSMGFSRQGYWSGLPCPPPGDLPNPGIEPRCPSLQADSLPSEPPGKPTPKERQFLFLFSTRLQMDVRPENSGLISEPPGK